MKGDFTRFTFRPDKHYSGVLMQQGRVQLDADWNEQVDITTHRVETETRDTIGPCGAPFHNAGFKITADPNQLTSEEQNRLQATGALPLKSGDLLVTSGRYYVDGILCENERAVALSGQPHLPDETVINAEGLYVVYLDVWQRHISALEDPEILEVALGGPDTATRRQTIWQVKSFRVGDVGKSLHCLSPLNDWKKEIAAGTGRLAARAELGGEPEGPCIVAAGGGYRRLENQLYRVEIHDSGELPEGEESGNGTQPPTFKWSRDNGSFVSRIEEIDKDTNTIVVASAGKDSVLRFADAQWVELSDAERVLRGESGILVELDTVEGRKLKVKEWPGGNAPTLDEKPTARRWESEGAITVAVPAENDGWIKLEDGVEVRFEPGSYRTGDYWLIPARTRGGKVLWPADDSGDPQPESPHGIQHHYCQLALVERGADGLTVKDDCRRLFPPVTELTSFFYVGGDGQEAMPDPTQPSKLVPLPRPLEAGVANGEWRVNGARVKFEIVSGGGALTAGGQSSTNFLIVETRNEGEEGVASCGWSLGGSLYSQRVKATLLDDAGDQVHLPIFFNANLSIASQVAYDPGECDNLANKTNVQAALDHLSALTHLSYLGGDGQEALPGEPLAQPLQVLVANECGPVSGAKVVFETQDEGKLASVETPLESASNTLTITTGSDGIARCVWQLDRDGGASQLATATLTNAGPNPIHVPETISFTGNLSVASQVAYQTDPECLALADATTVQTAIERLSSLAHLAYLGGDGQEALPGRALAQPLRVLVANECGPVSGAKVVFNTNAEGKLAKADTQFAGASNTLTVTTGPDGIAQCVWQLDPDGDASQLATATLTNAGPNPIHVPVTINFTGNLSVAIQVAYQTDPEQCPALKKATTVQEAIDILCRRPTGGGCRVTVGKGGQFERLDEAVEQLIKQKQFDICLCLLPGSYDVDKELNLSRNGLRVSISGCGPASTQIKLQKPLRFSGQSFALRSCRVWGSVGDQPLLELAASERIHLADNVIQAFTPLSRMANLVDASAASLATAEQPTSLTQPASVATEFARAEPTARSALADNLDSEMRRLDSAALLDTERNVLGGITTHMRSSTFNVDAMIAALTRVNELVRLSQPGLAVVIQDARAETLLDHNRIFGIVSFYGPPPPKPLTETQLNLLGLGVFRGDVKFASTDRSLQLRNNRMTRVVAGKAVVEQIQSLLEAASPPTRPRERTMGRAVPPIVLPQPKGFITETYRNILLTANVIESPDNLLIGESHSLASTHFLASPGAAIVVAGYVLGIRAVFAGTLGSGANADMDKTIKLFDVTQRETTQAATLGLAIEKPFDPAAFGIG